MCSGDGIFLHPSAVTTNPDSSPGPSYHVSVTHHGHVSREQVWINKVAARKRQRGNVIPIPPSALLSRRNSPFQGVRKNNLSERRMLRKLMYRRIMTADFGLMMAIVGIAITIIEAELRASGVIAKVAHPSSQASTASIILRVGILATTLALLASIGYYHYADIRVGRPKTPKGPTVPKVGTQSSQGAQGIQGTQTQVP